MIPEGPEKLNSNNTQKIALMAEMKVTKNTGRAVLTVLDIDCLMDIEQCFRQIEEELGVVMYVSLYGRTHAMARKGEPIEGLWLKADGLQAVMSEEKLMLNQIAGGLMPVGSGRLTRKRCEGRLHGCAA